MALGSDDIKRYRVDIREHALEEIEAIGAYIARRNPLNAERYTSDILDAIDGLASFPDAHPASKDLTGLGIRYAILGSHRIYFRVLESRRVVDVFCVVDARRSARVIRAQLRSGFEQDGADA